MRQEGLENNISRHVKRSEELLSFGKETILSPQDLLYLAGERHFFLCLQSLFQESFAHSASIVGRIDEALMAFFHRCTDDTMTSIMLKIDRLSIADFLESFVFYKAYTNVSDVTIFALLEDQTLPLILVLKNDFLREYYHKAVIRYIERHTDVLVNLLIDHTLSLPSSLSSFYLSDLFSDYMRHHHLNVAQASRLSQLHSVDGRMIERDVRLYASYKLLDLLRTSLPQGHLIYQDVFYDFKYQNQDKTVQVENDELHITYNRYKFERRMDEAALLNHFLYSFAYCDYQGRLKSSSVYHRVSVYKQAINPALWHFADELYDSFIYKQIDEIKAYSAFLNEYDHSLEQIISWFFSIYLPYFFKQGQIKLSFKEGELTEKIHRLLHECRRMIQIYEHERRFLDTEAKYIYPKEDGPFAKLSYLLFDESSPLNDGRYDCFYEAIVHRVHAARFDDLLSPYLSYLSKMHVIDLSAGLIRPLEKAKVLKELYEEGVIVRRMHPYTQYVIDEMYAEGIISYDSSFMTRDEVNQYTYLMKKAIKNPQPQEEDYWILILMMIECIIKINDEMSNYTGGHHEH